MFLTWRPVYLPARTKVCWQSPWCEYYNCNKYIATNHYHLTRYQLNRYKHHTPKTFSAQNSGAGFQPQTSCKSRVKRVRGVVSKQSPRNRMAHEGAEASPKSCSGRITDASTIWRYRSEHPLHSCQGPRADGASSFGSHSVKVLPCLAECVELRTARWPRCL